MTGNDIKRRVTAQSIRDFEASLAQLDADARDRPEWIRRALRAALESQLADLRSELVQADER